MTRYKAYISLGLGRGQQTVYIMARNADDARRLLEMQYGRGTVSSVQFTTK